MCSVSIQTYVYHTKTLVIKNHRRYHDGTYISLSSWTECSTKDSSGLLKLNSPIVIAWSSSGHNHFIPLVPIKGKPLPKLPQALCPKVWGPGDDATLLQQ